MMRSIFGIFLVLLTAMPQVSAQLNSYSRSELAFDNALAGYNPGFESGTVKWTASGGTFVVNSGTQFITGSKQFASWDSNSASQEVCSSLVKVPESGNCAVSLTYKVPSGTATHKIVAKDGSKDLSVEDVVSSTAAWRHDVEFPCAAAASNQARVCIRSVASNEPAIQLDGGYAGESRTVLEVERELGPTTAYTPTLNSMTGVSAVNGTKQRVGDGYNLVVSVAFNGTGANGTFSASVPSDCTIDQSKLPVTSTYSSVRNGVGFWGWYDDAGGGATDDQFVRTATSSTVVLLRGSNTVNSNMFANNDGIVLNFRVPCTGFEPTTIVSTERQRVPVATVYKSGSGTFNRQATPATHLQVRTCYGGSGNTTFGSITTSSGCDVTIIPAPGPTYSYAVGSGGSGLIEVVEHFNFADALIANSVRTRDSPSAVINTVVTPTTTYTATLNEDTIFAAMSGAWTLSLPPAASAKGKQYRITISSGSDALTIDPSGSETICGYASIRMRGASDSITITSNGSAWTALDRGCFRTVHASVTGSNCTTTPCSLTSGTVGVSMTRSGTGSYALNYSGVIRSDVIPTCTCGSNLASFSGGVCFGSNTTGTEYPFYFRNTADSLFDNRPNVVCVDGHR